MSDFGWREPQQPMPDHAHDPDDQPATLLTRILLTISLVVLLVAVAGGTTWWLYSQNPAQQAAGHAAGPCEQTELRVARFAAIGIGAISIALAIPAQKLNIAFLVALAFAVAASANLPALLFNLFWRRFNTSGAVWSIYGGLISAVVLVVFSPVVSGKPTSMIPDADFAWFPLSNPGIVSIPLGFLFGVLGTYLGRDRSSETRYNELSVRAHTGAGAEGVARH